MKLKNNQTILFQGDSITDCGRRETAHELGNGYAMMVATQLYATHPSMDLHFLNRGISGNRAKDLRARWREDCIELKPDWVSILIGINDCWRAFDRNDPTSAEAYERDYFHILEEIRSHTQAGILVMEPFLLPCPEDWLSWRVDLDPKIEVARRLAREFDAIHIPLDSVFQKLLEHKRPEFWAADGVHPTPAGHAVIAREWLHAVGA